MINKVVNAQGTVIVSIIVVLRQEPRCATSIYDTRQDVFPANKTNSGARSPQANNTDGATANCRQNLVPTFEDRGVSRSQRGGPPPPAVKISFLDRSRYFSFK
jgi:hypothetical protein